MANDLIYRTIEDLQRGADSESFSITDSSGKVLYSQKEITQEEYSAEVARSRRRFFSAIERARMDQARTLTWSHPCPAAGGKLAHLLVGERCPACDNDGDAPRAA